MTEYLQTPVPAPVRPRLLTTLCILSYIGSSMGAFSYFMIFSAYSQFMPMIEEMGLAMPGMELYLSAGRNFFLAGAVFYFLSLIGVALMWRLRKVGFHFYTASQVMILIMPLFYIQGFPIPFLDGIITALFIFLYYRFYPFFV
ncbi:MAG TPA: hypothetical protein VFC92_03280 [Bacteroidales bacterium]|nr:hypothetical protein [Bacteroidales bacterium]